MLAFSCILLAFPAARFQGLVYALDQAFFWLIADALGLNLLHDPIDVPTPFAEPKCDSAA